MPYSIFFIDSFDLMYRRLYQAVDGSLSCRGDGNPVVTVTGFQTPDILLFDFTNPTKPALVKAVTIDSGGGSYRISFIPSSPESMYAAVSASSVPSVLNLAGRTSSGHALQIEINRAIYMDETRYTQSADFATLQRDLGDLLKALNDLDLTS